MENQKTFKEKNVPTNTSHKKRGGKEKEIPNIQSIEFSTVNKKPVTNKSKPDKLNQNSDRINNELLITNRLKGHSARALIFEEQRSPCTERPARVFPTFSLNTAAGTHVPSTSSGNKCLLSGLPQPDLSNLVRFHKSPLGKSAPSLSANMMELGISRRSSRSTAAHRLSLIAGVNTSPVLHRSHSPVSSGSPVDSPPPRTFSPSLHLVSAAVPIKRGTVGCRGDGRRWSVASLPSSGYGTTPGSSNISSKCSSQERLHQLPNVPTGDEIKLFTGTAVAAAVSSDENLVLHQPPFRRPRSRSLSSSSRSPVVDEMPTMDMLYKERFPKATQEMEEKLRSFLNENKELEHSSSHEADLPIARFVHHQVLEIARDCLTKSEAKLITSEYFCEISEKLERLKIETKEKSPQAATHITNLITKLLLIISRPALLLECFEFSLEEFYHLMEAAEGEAKMMQVIKTDIPQYIIQKLGLNRDPIAELQQELKSSEPEEEERKPTTISTTPTEEDFEVLKLISNGAYGAVYLVKHKQTRQRFAMKKINKNNLILRNQVEQVFAERDILSFADNPFVVSMYCSFETRRHLCLVMEYVEGGDCASLLKNIGPLPSDMARFYFAETVLAVEYLHSYGIVHRDLKPDNLLITVLGHIKLTDFGLSKMGLMSLATNLYEGHINSETQEFSDKQLIGTPEYIAPEVILRQGYGKPIDWWSMGIILYEFIVGCVPFYGDSVEELFDRIVRDDVDWPEDEDWPIQLEAKDLVICLLSKSPRDRLGTASPHEVKEHMYFIGLDWNSLLRQKAEFVPELKNDEDTSYFDSRLDRYNHEIADDTDDTDESSVFPSFSSCPRQYRQVGPRLGSDSSIGSLNTPSRGHFSSPVMPTTPDTPDAMTDFHKLRITYALTPDSENPLYWKMLLELNNKALSTPESSQTDSDDVSPQTHRKRRTGHTRDPLPRLAVSMEDELSSGYEVGTSSSESVREQLQTPVAKHRSRSVVKSASATGLSLIIPSEFQTDAMNLHSPSRGGGSSTASSRDASPCREPSPLVTSYKPPIMIKRGPSGFGFSVHTVRVYYGDTDFYTTHHLVMAVDEGGPAYESGLRPTDLITHVNGETVQGLYHSQVLQLLLGGGEQVILRATPLEHTSIQTGGRKRSAGQSKLARRPFRRQRKQKRGVTDTATDKRRKASLFRKISSKRASVEMQQMISTPTMGPTNRNQSFACATDGPFINHSPIRIPSEGSPAGRSSLVLSDNSSRSSTASSSAGETPPGVPPQPHYQRPSTLHGLKHKLHSSPCSKPLHKAGTGGPGRRKSIGHMPLSPLARTPSPGPLPASPTRSPSPLTFPVGHQQGSSNTTQSYSPGVLATRSPAQGKKSYVRPKSAEPGSPLLRRALSPDRLHPRSAEGKISPLCSSTGASGVKTTPRVSAGLASTGASVWRPASGNPAPVLTERNTAEPTETAGVDKDQTGQNTASSTVLSLPLAGPGEFLPRIAEEKDSPTNVGAETQSFSSSNENKDAKKNDGLG